MARSLTTGVSFECFQKFSFLLIQCCAAFVVYVFSQVVSLGEFGQGFGDIISKVESLCAVIKNL